jgi:DNA-binding GntR family transcriptional regulator
MPRVSTADRVHDTLREAITSGELPGGSHHSIYQLAQQLGVSRTPVRDAILRLADAGMVEIDRNRGIRVRGLSAHDIQEIFELRLLIEVPAAAAAARDPSPALLTELDDRVHALTRAAGSSELGQFMVEDRLLHATILRASGNARLLATVESLRDATAARGVSTMNQTRGLDEIRHEHQPIVAAIRAGDPRAAAHHMHAHLVTTAELLLRQAADAGDETVSEWPPRLAPLS